jgi:hypothetical protein
LVLTPTLPAEQSRKTCPMERPGQVPVAEFDHGDIRVVRRTGIDTTAPSHRPRSDQHQCLRRHRPRPALARQHRPRQRLTRHPRAHGTTKGIFDMTPVRDAVIGESNGRRGGRLRPEGEPRRRGDRPRASRTARITESRAGRMEWGLSRAQPGQPGPTSPDTAGRPNVLGSAPGSVSERGVVPSPGLAALVRAAARLIPVECGRRRESPGVTPPPRWAWPAAGERRRRAAHRRPARWECG